VTGGARKNADAVLVTAIATGLRNDKAAEQAGVSQATVYRRLRDAGFRQRVQDERTEMVSQTLGRLTYVSASAVEKLARLMLSAESEAVQLGACRTLLESTAKWRETDEFEQRIHALEEQAVEQLSVRQGPWAA
jgi:hypothetical protein